MGILRLFKMTKNYLGWKKENRKKNFTTLYTVGNRNKVEVGDYTYGRLNVFMWNSSEEKLKIGRFCSIAPTSRFICGGEHNLNTISTYPFDQKILGIGVTKSRGPIILDDDVWIGDAVIILSGVHIGQGAVIGAGALVTHDIPPYAIAIGVPARVIKFRFSQDIICKLVSCVDYSKLSKKTIKKNFDTLSALVTEQNVNDIIKIFNDDENEVLLQ